MHLEKLANKNLLDRKRTLPVAMLSLALGLAACKTAPSSEQPAAARTTHAPTRVNQHPANQGSTQTSNTLTPKSNAPSSITPESSTTTINPGVAVAETPPGVVNITPNLKWFCGNTPCSAAILSEPRFVDPQAQQDPLPINVDPQKTEPEVFWPEGKSNTYPGDPVSVVCYTTKGQPEGQTKSTETPDWYEIAVPTRRVKNPDFYFQIHQINSPVKTFSFEGQEAVYGWAPLSFFAQSSPDSRVPQCSGG